MIGRVKLNKRDRDNINTLCRIADKVFGINDGKRVISFNRDQDILLTNGFSYGVTRASMFGTDKLGQLWQVTTLGSRSTNFAETVWYEVDDRGLRHRKHGDFTIRDFYERFKSV